MFHLIFDVLCGFALGIGFAMVLPNMVASWKMRLLRLFDHKCD